MLLLLLLLLLVDYVIVLYSLQTTTYVLVCATILGAAAETIGREEECTNQTTSQWAYNIYSVWWVDLAGCRGGRGYVHKK